MDKDILKKAIGILAQIRYEQCILFGSQARGDASADSDYDFLLVTKNQIPDREKIKMASALRKQLAQQWINADVIIKSEDEVEYLKDRPGSVVRNALEEGIRV